MNTEFKYNQYPPNIDKVREVLDVSKPGVIFTYGNEIYIPSGIPLPDHLEVHEGVHVKQQYLMGKDTWWEQYLHDEQFRLSQELEAYREQMRFIKQRYSRDYRRMMLNQLAKDLSSGIYGKVIDKHRAKQLILEGL